MTVYSKTKMLVDEAVSAQLAPWLNSSIKYSSFREKVIEKSNAKASIFTYQIRSEGVDLIDKEFRNINTSSFEEWQVLLNRAIIYRDMIEASIFNNPIEIDVLIAIDVGDMADDQVNLPIFSFQKRRGQSTILLPDFEFGQYNFTRPNSACVIPFHEKKTMAVFAGSTTGAGHISMEVAREAAAPRLRAHQFFRSHANVDFRLPSIVQTGGDEVVSYLRSQGLGEPTMDWDETFRHKFAISIDGNGATCSRVAFIIDSTSVLLKYDSEFVLYWTELIRPDIHYIAVHHDTDILEVLKTEHENRERYIAISRSAREFAEYFLSRSSIELYISSLLDRYSLIFQ